MDQSDQPPNKPVFPPFSYAEALAYGSMLLPPIIGVLVLIFSYRVTVPDALALLVVSATVAVLGRGFTIRRLIAGLQLVALGREYHEATELPGAAGADMLARLNQRRQQCLRALAIAMVWRIAGLGLVTLTALYLDISLRPPSLTDHWSWFFVFLWALTTTTWHKVIGNFPPGWLRAATAMAVGILLPAPFVLYLITTGALAIFEGAFHPGLNRHLADYYAVWFERG
jgi:hypothetical protein